MTPQEIFDKVAVALLTQGKKSVTFDGLMYVCRYRGDNGCRCAIGHLIADNVYHPLLEGRSCDAKVVTDALISSGVDHPRADPFLILLLSLQNVHDCAEPDSWHRRLTLVASEYDLSDSCLSAWAKG